MTEISLEDAYREACMALGEEVVRGRLAASEMQRLTVQNESLLNQLRHEET